MTSKKLYSQSPKKQRAITKPEVVYRVTKKQKKAPKNSRASQSIKYKHFLTATLSKKQTITILVIVVCIALSVVSVSGYKMLIALYNANESAQPIAVDARTKMRIQLMGDVNNYPNEIINYADAPKDLQDYILRDYTKLKASCIVNGKLNGTVQYALMHIEDSSYAKITKGCTITDTIILAKVSDVWTLIFIGNDMPRCAEVYAYNVPRSIVPSCVTDNTTYTNPIP